MGDEAKATSAKERLAAAKKAAEEAEVVETTTEDAVGFAADALKDNIETTAEEAVEQQDIPDSNAAETTDTADHSDNAAEPVDGDQTDGAPLDETSSDDDVALDDTQTNDRPAEEQHPEDDSGGSFAATVLKILVILIVGAAAALWAGPRIAPHLPGWAAPVAAFLSPGETNVSDRLESVAAETDARIAEVSGQLAGDISAANQAAAAADQKAADALAAVDQAKADLTTTIEDVAAEPRADIARLNDLATRLASAEATVEGLRAELDALNGVTGENAAPSAEVLARVAAFGAAVEGLRAEIGDLKSRTSEIEALARSEDLVALAHRIAALEDGEAATSGARDEADVIRRSANTDAAIARIAQAVLSGAPYDVALADATSLSGAAAPAALSDHASTGLPTQDELTRGFPDSAQAGYAASLSENAGEGFTAGVMAALQGRLGGRPSVETPGDGAGAVLSRVEARLNEGRLDAAVAEAEALSEPTKAAMQGWLNELAKAANGAAALAEYRAAVSAN